MDEKRKQAIERLKTASPLEMTSLLKELELYDKESSQKVIDDVYEQFASGDNMQDEILVPVFSAVIDGLLEATSFGRKARKKGLTASRVIQECKQFSYDEKTNHALTDACHCAHGMGTRTSRKMAQRRLAILKRQGDMAGCSCATRLGHQRTFR